MGDMINNGLSGLRVSQQVLNTTSHNIANINTPGFTRQEAVITARANGSPGMASGDGVEVTSIRRVMDQFANASLWRASSQSGYFSKMESLYGQVEGIVGSKSLSIAKGLDDFFASLSAASDKPASTATRQQVISEAKSLANRFNRIAENLDLQEQNLSEEVTATMGVINNKAKTIAKLNESIAEAVAKGTNPSSLRDQRENLIKDLSKLVDVRIEENKEGKVTVSLKDGQPLVLGTGAGEMSYSGGTLDLTYRGQVFSVEDVGGGVGAMVEYKDTVLADMRTDLNTQAKKIADDINNQLAAGYDLNGNPGVPLFTYSTPTGEALSISVSDTIQTDELAFIGDDGAGAPVGGPGDNTNLKAIIDLKDPFYTGFNNTLGKLGIESAQAQAESKASFELEQDAQFRRDSVSSVNEDEEAAKMMQYTQAYQANAKVISTADRVFNILLGAIN